MRLLRHILNDCYGSDHGPLVILMCDVPVPDHVLLSPNLLLESLVKLVRGELVCRFESMSASEVPNQKEGEGEDTESTQYHTENCQRLELSWGEWQLYDAGRKVARGGIDFCVVQLVLHLHNTSGV